MKMLFSPVHMRDRDLPAWKAGEPVIFTVDNRYEFTNLSELTLAWSIGSISMEGFIPILLRDQRADFHSPGSANQAGRCVVASISGRQGSVGDSPSHAIGNRSGACNRASCTSRPAALSARTVLARRPHGALHRRQL